MQYINNIIQVIIYINILFCTLMITRMLISKVAQKYTTVKQYQISNWYFATFCCCFYILVPGLGLYYLRFGNINRELDLKIVYHNIYDIVSMILNVPYIYSIPILILALLFLINILLILRFTYKTLNNEIYKLYFFLRYNLHDRSYSKSTLATITKKLGDFHNTDIISFYSIDLFIYANVGAIINAILNGIKTLMYLLYYLLNIGINANYSLFIIKINRGTILIIFLRN
jgi:hypothetical protein